GLFAREQGARVPARLVASSKSWLCHAAVDRTAAILPWGAGDEVTKVSPVEASARTLTHLREAWDASFPAPLAEQDVILTVPASFDEVARGLTLAAARPAGLPGVVRREEPQAAFYAWLAANERDWRARVAAHPLVLVIDVGGGTTDLSLIAARASRGELGLERVAVGEHLLLGGDNIDLALAREVEARLLARGGQLDSQRFNGLVSQCRAAKERLLADPCPGEARLSVPGRGGAVVGGALAARLTRVEVEAVVLDRFFPRVAADARARRGTGPAPREGALRGRTTWGSATGAPSAACRAAWRRARRSRSPSPSSSCSPTGPCPFPCSRRRTGAGNTRATSSRPLGWRRSRPSAPCSASGASWSRPRSRCTSRYASRRSARSRSGAARAPPTTAGASSSACASRWERRRRPAKRPGW